MCDREGAGWGEQQIWARLTKALSLQLVLVVVTLALASVPEVAFNCVLVEFINMPILCALVFVIRFSCFTFASHLASTSATAAATASLCLRFVGLFRCRTVVAYSFASCENLQQQLNIWITHVECQAKRLSKRERAKRYEKCIREMHWVSPSLSLSFSHSHCRVASC